MTTPKFVSVAACVAAIVTSFIDGADLVAKIKGKESARISSHDGSPQDVTSQALQASLNRGAELVQSQFSRDATRFGDQYRIGDRMACEALEDVMIQLQDQMIADLRIHSYQETISDFSVLQDVSNSTQDRVALILLQLQQRVIMAHPIEQMTSVLSLGDPHAPDDKHQHHTTIRDLDISTTTQPVRIDPRDRELPPLPHTENTRVSFEAPTNGSGRSPPDIQKQSAPIDAFIPLPAPKTTSPPTQDGDSEERPKPKPRTSIFGKFGRHRKAPSNSSANTTGSSEGADGSQHSVTVTQVRSDPIGASVQRPSNQRAVSAASIYTRKAPERRLSQRDSSSTADSTSISGNSQAEYSPWGAHANQDAKSFVSSNTSRTSEDTQSKRMSFKQPIAPSTITVITANQDSPSATDLLPSEANNYSGFCKGAWRLQIGDQKKALQECQRPGNMYGAVKFWQCKHCNFQGRLIQRDKKTKDFDQQIMLAEGIQFRWVFLFKSHVECKDANPNPLKSPFGCMFCCAEGKGTPVFEGAQALMDHSQVHRIREPVGEVLYRMNAYVGEEAPIGADYDINLDAKEGLTI
ncbi:MAG: hypothetical protein Q9169_003896 [Polycauliona sp. 2 TL-2023]